MRKDIVVVVEQVDGQILDRVVSVIVRQIESVTHAVDENIIFVRVLTKKHRNQRREIRVENTNDKLTEALASFDVPSQVELSITA